MHYACSLLLIASVASAATNPVVTDRVFFDVSIGGKPAGRIVMELFGEVNSTKK